MAGEQTQQRQGAGDYLGCVCEACGGGQYGFPALRGDTPPGEAARILGAGLERDPGTGHWIKVGVVRCNECGDQRDRFISEGEVQARRDANSRRFVEEKAQELYTRLSKCTDRGEAVAVFVEALEENWGPLAEVIDRVVRFDEAFGTPTWGHPYWTAKLGELFGAVAGVAGTLPHPGNEFTTRLPGQVEEVELEPPAEGAETLRAFLIALSAMAVRWIISIDSREQKEREEALRIDQVIATMADDVRRWAAIDYSREPLDEQEAEERAAIQYRGQKHWLALSLSAAPGAQEALASTGVRPATPEEAESVARTLEAQRQPRPVQEPQEQAEPEPAPEVLQEPDHDQELVEEDEPPPDPPQKKKVTRKAAKRRKKVTKKKGNTP